MRELEAGLGEVEATLAPLLKTRGLTLVDAEWGRQGRRPVLRLFVDKPGGVTVGDCEGLSREAGDVLDVSGLIGPSYDLEVSSPGLDRELRTEREFDWAVGREVRVWFRQPIDGRTEICGRLTEALPDRIVLGSPEGGPVAVPRDLVGKARLEAPRPSRQGMSKA